MLKTGDEKHSSDKQHTQFLL